MYVLKKKYFRGYDYDETQQHETGNVWGTIDPKTPTLLIDRKWLAALKERLYKVL